MTYVKNKLRNRMSDKFLCNCLIAFIEIDVLEIGVLKRKKELPQEKVYDEP
ncbi:hypothetical protein LINPERPRIM_LOCUS21883 [Linum perenne]